jgi:hypothetical protein
MTNHRNPRASVNYANTTKVIDLLLTDGPMDLERILAHTGMTRDQFREARYSLPGLLAMEDAGVTIPRPVRSEGFIYKLADNYRTGNVDDDAEPSLQAAVSDLLTRVATIYLDVEKLEDAAPARSAVQRVLRKLRRSLAVTVERAGEATEEVEATLSRKAEYVLENLP